MRNLTREEERFLVCHCMESEDNMWLALAIGEVLRKVQLNVLRKLGLELHKSVTSRADRRWKGRLGIEDPWDIEAAESKKPEYPIYVMTMEDQEIETRLVYEISTNRAFVGTPAECHACPQADDLASRFRAKGLPTPKKNNYWRWWFYPHEDHGLDYLSKLHGNKEFREEEIAGFTGTLVRSAAAISDALEA